MQWYGDVEAKPAPGKLRRVQAYINTLDRESGQDRLAIPADAAEWLIANDLLEPGPEPIAEQLEIYRDAREALRELVIHNTTGVKPSAGAMAVLRGIGEAARPHLTVGDAGELDVVATGSAADRLLTLLLDVRDAQLDGTWTHLRACANEECRWAFYDRSRNHGGTWCDMATCGNKLKNRDFRARRRTR